ncbi:MAG: HAMP domain-containing histidine kinase [Actinomycetota bacterium]|nr:HAMP domain-containing histidine kinase [Actinomycetota bacterium]
MAFFLAGAILVAVMNAFLIHTLGTNLAHEAAPELIEPLRARFKQEHDRTLRVMLVVSLVSLGAVGLTAGGFGWLLAGRALRPLQEITATARRVAGRSLHERIARRGPDDEIKDLADTFDAMLQRLDRAFDSQRRFVAHASHELRTPLTINRTLLEVALDNPEASEPLRQLATNLIAVNQRHERLIDGLLTLASSEERLTVRSPVDLADLARHITGQAQATVQETGVLVRCELARAPVAGDPILLERLTQNLIDNALHYNIADHGWIAVTTDTIERSAILTVENTGPPVPDREVPSLFEPFRRLAVTERRATPSDNHQAGLGLSIVRSITHAHSGDIHATSRADGGLVIRVRIPADLGHAPVEFGPKDRSDTNFQDRV